AVLRDRRRQTDVYRARRYRSGPALLHRLIRQVEPEARARAGHGLDTDPATVARDDPLHGGETDAAARKLVVAMQALERREQLPGARHVEADAVVAHDDATHAVALA